MKNTILIFLLTTFLFLFNLTLLCGDDTKIEDARIQGYRLDYRKIKKDHIQIPSKYKRSEKKEVKEKSEIHEDSEKSKQNDNAQKSQVAEDIDKKCKPVVGAGYVGDVVEGMREGKGRLVLENGDIYEGYWKKGVKSGHGIYIYADGMKYNGNWENDRMNGIGSLMLPDGSFYYGEFKNGQMTGVGMFRYSDGAVYEGEWKEGMWHGKGVFRLTDGRELKAVFANHQVIEIIKENNDKQEKAEQNDTDNESSL